MATTARQTKTSGNNYGYTNLGNNIYQVTNSNGNRYRVRASVNGTQHDQYFTNKAKAVKFRNQLLKSRS
jgi:hypothetical protein